MNIEMKKHAIRRILTEGLQAANERSVSYRVSEHLRCRVSKCVAADVWRRRVFEGESEWFGWVLVSEEGECLTVRVFDLAIWEWVWEWQIWVSKSECESDWFRCLRVSLCLKVWEWQVRKCLKVWVFESLRVMSEVWKLDFNRLENEFLLLDLKSEFYKLDFHMEKFVHVIAWKIPNSSSSNSSLALTSSFKHSWC